MILQDIPDSSLLLMFDQATCSNPEVRNAPIIYAPNGVVMGYSSFNSEEVVAEMEHRTACKEEK